MSCILEAGRRIDKELKWGPAQSRETAYWLALTRKYERAARYPWLTVEPDPAPSLSDESLGAADPPGLDPSHPVHRASPGIER